MQINPFEQKVRIYPCKNESLSLMKWYNKKTEAVLSNRSNDFRGVQSVSDVIRTHDLPLRRRTLYPAELRRHFYNETIISDFSLAGKKLYNIVIHTLCG